MAFLQPVHIAESAYHAGFRGNALTLAVAVSLAESAGNTAAVGYNPPTQGCPNGSVDRGLWQINNCYHAEVSDQCSYDAMCCASAAYRISNAGSNWSPWSTYNNGAYRAQLARAAEGVSQYLRSHTSPHPKKRPWHIELHPWHYRAQLTMPTQAGWPPTNRYHDCLMACLSMVLQYEYGQYWSEDHLLDIEYPQGHVGDVVVTAFMDLATRLYGLHTEWIEPSSMRHTLWLTWRALRHGHPLVAVGYLDVNGQRLPHAVVATGMGPSGIIIADPATGRRLWQGHRQYYERALLGLILVDRGR